MDFAGTWHIYEMGAWDEDYFNMEAQAYIIIDPDGAGEFQFGLVFADTDGKVVEHSDGERLEFSWQGSDEDAPVNGCGWMKMKDANTVEGEFRFHYGDDSTFAARRVERQ